MIYTISSNTDIEKGIQSALGDKPASVFTENFGFRAWSFFQWNHVANHANVLVRVILILDTHLGLMENTRFILFREHGNKHSK